MNDIYTPRPLIAEPIVVNDIQVDAVDGGVINDAEDGPVLLFNVVGRLESDEYVQVTFQLDPTDAGMICGHLLLAAARHSTKLHGIVGENGSRVLMALLDD